MAFRLEKVENGFGSTSDLMRIGDQLAAVTAAGATTRGLGAHSHGGGLAVETQLLRVGHEGGERRAYS